MPQTCHLCGANAELQLSHYMPSFAYKIVTKWQRKIDGGRPLTVLSGTMLQTDRQAIKRLLCFHCEQKFSKYGEKYTSEACWRDNDSFALRDLLAAATPSAIVGDQLIYYGRELPAESGVLSLYYFALSVLWRGSVADWPGTSSQYRNALGPRYEREIRRYLLGEAEPPMDCVVCVDVDASKDIHGMIALPTRVKQRSQGRQFYQHVFLVPGIRFRVFVGGSFISDLDVAPGDPVLFKWKFIGSDTDSILRQKVGSAAKRGKLAQKKLPRP